MTARPDITASPNDQNTTGETHITSGSRRTVCSAWGTTCSMDYIRLGNSRFISQQVDYG